jgi:hypothetical protein
MASAPALSQSGTPERYAALPMRWALTGVVRKDEGDDEERPDDDRELREVDGDGGHHEAGPE